MAARLKRLISIKRIFNLSAIMKEVYIFPLNGSIVLRAPIPSIMLCPVKSGSQTFLPISPGVNTGQSDSQQKPIRG